MTENRKGRKVQKNFLLSVFFARFQVYFLLTTYHLKMSVYYQSIIQAGKDVDCIFLQTVSKFIVSVLLCNLASSFPLFRAGVIFWFIVSIFIIFLFCVISLLSPTFSKPITSLQSISLLRLQRKVSPDHKSMKMQMDSSK